MFTPKYDLSVIVPSIRTKNLEQLFFSIERSVQPYSFEFIVVSPFGPPEALLSKDNFKFVRDLGSPSRAIQIGSLLVESARLCWMSDDGIALPEALSQCLGLYESGEAKQKDAVALRYYEGEGSGMFPDDYWRAHHHADQRLAGIKDHYKIAPLGMYDTLYFRELGGLDCRYMHCNMNTHDLAFRLQNAGGLIHLSPSLVAKFYWSWITADAEPVQKAYFQNDKALYTQEYSHNQDNRIKIDYNNWMDQPSKWEFRFGK